VPDPVPERLTRATLSDHDVERAQRLLMLEFGSRADFDNPRLEYRRLFAEILGTFMLVLVAAGGGVLQAEGQISAGPVGARFRAPRELGHSSRSAVLRRDPFT
jgi:hypothetical protein